MEKVLLIDDDVELCSMLTDYLGRYGFHVTSIHRGDAGLKTAREHAWTMILLDVMLPGMDGFEVLKQLRGTSAARVVLLTARGDDVDRIVGLEMGADDYLPKPFNPRELLARIRAVLRRNEAVEPESDTSTLRVDDLELSTTARSVQVKGKTVEVTDVEFALLEVLMRSPGKVVSREDLAESVLGRSLNSFDRSLDMHVSRLRRKLDEADSSGDRVKTVRGAGYQLAVYKTPSERD
jgi:DNA-binding response OmpR family regulator